MSKTPIFVLSGPTAVGKGTVEQELRARYPQVCLSVSATTRKPRPGEVHGVDYFFVSDPEFDDMIEAGGLLEWATVHGSDRYGTPRAWVEAQLAAGSTILLEVDLEGARQLRQSLPDATFVFLAPPSWEELQRRLAKRGTEDEAQQRRRLETARVELAAADEFSAIVINDNIGSAVAQLADIMGLD